MSDNHVGLEAVPDDEDMVKWLRVKSNLAHLELLKYLEEYKEIVEYGESQEEPKEFAYARLLNNLATIEQPELIKMLSAAIYFRESGGNDNNNP